MQTHASMTSVNKNQVSQARQEAKYIIKNAGNLTKDDGNLNIRASTSEVRNGMHAQQHK
jgi:hypothetical protein